jgi:Protein of unknown function (DUF1761)
MTTLFTEINWLAVIIATIAYSAFSGIWHKQFAFGKKWEEAMGFVRPEGWKETSIYYIVPSIGCLTASIAMSILVNLLPLKSINEAILLGLIVGIGFGTTVTFTNAIIPIMKKPTIFGAITGTAHALSITLVTVIIYSMK